MNDCGDVQCPADQDPRCAKHPTTLESFNDFPAWGNRLGPAVVAFNGELWLLGGLSFTRSTVGPNGQVYSAPAWFPTLQSEIWSSSDGHQWNQRGQLPFTLGVSAVVFNQRIWAIAEGALWSSANGTAWTQESSQLPFGNRAIPALVVFQGNLWLLGGRDVTGQAPTNDVWSTVDGTTWRLELAHAPWSPRTGHNVVSHQNKLWLIGGGSGPNDVWSTADGIHWTQAAPNLSSLPPTTLHQALSFSGKLWVLGGETGQGSRPRPDLWVSDDGVDWWREPEPQGWEGVSGHQAVVFQQSLILLGGASRTGPRGDVWKLER